MKRYALAFVVAFAAGSAAHAAVINDPIVADLDSEMGYTLEEVIEAGGILVGDKLFNDFSVTPIKSGATASAPDVDLIKVTGIVDLDGNYGLRFNGPWKAGIDEIANTTIRFTVEATDPGFYITDAHFWLTGAGVKGDGLVNAVENIFSADPLGGAASIASMMVQAPANAAAGLEDEAYFAPLKKIWVVKDIIVQDNPDASQDPGIAHLSEFYQTFSQIPEPASFVLAATGLGLMLVGRRRMS